jgi:hypothetical protein
MTDEQFEVFIKSIDKINSKLWWICYWLIAQTITLTVLVSLV